jgi:hypothetical protein
MQEIIMLRPIMAFCAAALLALTFATSEATARPGGGFRGGFGGFHAGGFRGFHGGFRGGFHHRGFRRFGPAVGLGLGLGYGLGYYPYSGYYPAYAYGDGCVAPRRIWTPYGWRVRWVNVCY